MTAQFKRHMLKGVVIGVALCLFVALFLTPRPVRSMERPVTPSTPTIGDVYEVLTSRGLAYLQFSHVHEETGPILRALPGRYEERPPNIQQLVANDERFFVQYDPAYALRHGLLRRVGTFPLPASMVRFPGFKHAERDVHGRAIEWEVWAGGERLVKAKLTSAERAYSLDGVVSDEYLVRMLSSDWRPEDDNDAPPADWEVDMTSSDADADDPPSVEHFLYFSTQSAATAGAQLLEMRGYVVDEVEENDEEWVVVVLTEEHSVQMVEAIAAVAAEAGGEYDGWGS